MPAGPHDYTDSSGVELRNVRNRELELKRVRGEISCAECRRLKLKCDKKRPCASCKRRGCQAICPNGILSSGQGSRFVLADTDRLHLKLAEMSTRIRQLEDALEIEHAERSSTRHPLLSDQLLAVKSGVDAATAPAAGVNEAVKEEELDVINAFGTLTLSEGSTMRFLGASATEHTLLMELDPQSHTYTADWQSKFPPELTQTIQMWPFVPSYIPKEDLFAHVQAQLPTWERITALCEAYLQNLSWYFTPVDRRQIYDELLPTFYPRNCSGERMHTSSATAGAGEGGSPVGKSSSCPDAHDLALLLMVCACGATGDLTLVQFNAEAEMYAQLARGALGLRSVFEGASLSSVQAVCMLGSYDVFSGRRNSLESSWKTLSFGLSLAASIGLHRDPARWNLDPKMILRRRRVFWEINALDHWKSLASGRPTAFAPAFVDCEFPVDDNTTLDGSNQILPGGRIFTTLLSYKVSDARCDVIIEVYRWKHTFARDILSKITEMLCTARPLKYSRILEMDRKIRDFRIHNHKAHTHTQNTTSPFAHLLPHASGFFRDIALLYIHRNFFARAILEFPDDPMSSPFAPSFMAAYRISASLLSGIRGRFDEISHLLYRLWPVWAHALSAAVIVGTVVSRVPSINFAPAAFLELELAIALFEKASAHPVVKHGLPLLLRLRDKAHQALYDARLGKHTSRSTGSSVGSDQRDPLIFRNSQDNPDDELTILRGTTRYVERKDVPATVLGTQPSSPSSSTTAASSTAAAPSPEAAAQGEPNRKQSSLFNMEDMFRPSEFVQSFPETAAAAASAPMQGTQPLQPDQPAWDDHINAALYGSSDFMNSTTNPQPQQPEWTSSSGAPGVLDFDFANHAFFDETQAPTFLPLPSQLSSFVEDGSGYGMPLPVIHPTEDVAMVEAWKSFIQDSGFNASAFEGWEGIENS